MAAREEAARPAFANDHENLEGAEGAYCVRLALCSTPCWSDYLSPPTELAPRASKRSRETILLSKTRGSLCLSRELLLQAPGPPRQVLPQRLHKAATPLASWPDMPTELVAGAKAPSCLLPGGEDIDNGATSSHGGGQLISDAVDHHLIEGVLLLLLLALAAAGAGGAPRSSKCVVVILYVVADWLLAAAVVVLPAAGSSAAPGRCTHNNSREAQLLLQCACLVIA